MTIDFNDGTWVRDFSKANERRQVCGCAVVFVYQKGWVREHSCDEHAQRTMPPCEKTGDAADLDESLERSLRDRGIKP